MSAAVQRTASPSIVADLKHLGLVVSVGAAVALRFFSDFSFATIQHQELLAHLDLVGLSGSNVLVLSLNTLSYQLQRDWFNLVPQAPAEVVGVTAFTALLYLGLRRVQPPVGAATGAMLLTPFIGILATLMACAWVLARSK